ncbi:MAG: adenosylcobinamide-GDP ribazoletransferase [Deltaproteobacteria bacterium]|nr:adenosylcobinamide-GDP ribazoletransferase [Deltaproteobacteria bacterium]
MNSKSPLFELAVATQFLTRLPVARDLDPTPEDLGRSTLYFPLIGLGVGALIALTANAALALGLPTGVAIVLALTLGVLVTGALHEDGLSDAADGLGGGWTREESLNIMRDSRIGNYGAVALVLLFALRIAALSEIAPSQWLGALAVAHALGRWSSVDLLVRVPYARNPDDAPGLGKNYGDTLPEGALVRATIMTALFAVAFLGVDGLLALVLAAAVSRLSGRYYQRKIGGITGDTLGATNVLCEVAVLMFVAAG